ncbi:MAG: alkaline phosphatase [Clostridiales bacterium]|nr:alkaline phosphatase [Clostridiales bacterium]
MKIKRLISVLLAAVFVVGIIAGTSVSASDTEKIKNVIFMIGDGMGENNINYAKAAEKRSLTMEVFPIRGQSETRSSSNRVTDSAAGGTALSCGIRTTNGCVGVFPLDPLDLFVSPKSLTERAAESGMKTGVITSDSTSGATPASFSVHTSSRKNEKDISVQQMHSVFDIIWGAASESVTQSEVEANGFTYINDINGMNALESGSRSFGQFAGDTWSSSPELDTTPTLSEMTEKSISLLSGSDKGFFLMVEGAHIDKFAHSNKGEEMTEALYEFDNAVSIALNFALRDRHTLIVITADHETGAIQLIDGEYQFTSGSHTGNNVPVFVYGSTEIINNGQAIKNREVSNHVASALGFHSGTNPGRIALFFKNLFNRV